MRDQRRVSSATTLTETRYRSTRATSRAMASQDRERRRQLSTSSASVRRGIRESTSLTESHRGETTSLRAPEAFVADRRPYSRFSSDVRVVAFAVL